ncbi:hypothetical protein MFLAVUS_002092 [Mucor flavus]|uniref:Uncharacterized protein n=1 Tax=Mucor flavus TaxID=439312 RepID=A0ABP9YPC4_9FUNG
MPSTKTKRTKRSRRANPNQSKISLPGCVITKVCRPKERQKRIVAQLGAPYGHVINAGYTLGGVFMIDIGVGFVDADNDTLMAEGWITDDVVMEEIWRKDVQYRNFLPDYHSVTHDIPQGNQITYQTSTIVVSSHIPRRSPYSSVVPNTRTPYANEPDELDSDDDDDEASLSREIQSNSSGAAQGQCVPGTGDPST